MEEKEKKFFEKIWTSIKDFEGYEELAAGKASKAIKYILLLTMIFTIIISLANTYKIYLSIQKVKEYVNENIEDITLENRKTKCSSRKRNNNRK